MQAKRAGLGNGVDLPPIEEEMVDNHNLELFRQKAASESYKSITLKDDIEEELQTLMESMPNSKISPTTSNLQLKKL